MAKQMGAKFSFGTNNFDDKPSDMSRCLEAIGKYQLTKDDLYVPSTFGGIKLKLQTGEQNGSTQSDGATDS